MAGIFEIYKDKAGEFRFRLKASNGQVIATGEGYKTRASAIKGIESVIKNSWGAKVVDLSSEAFGTGGEVLAPGTSEFPPGSTAGELAKGSGAAGPV
jgi:uncharacterized protein YegP (UPF0339 family)